MSKVSIICLTPVKNEAWILDRFLQCASLWADHIIIADQQSDDGSREIASKYSKVILIDNPSPTFNEPERQKLLINEARKIPGSRLLITLDADEMLTANFKDSPEWQTILQAPIGTVINFQWVNLCPDMKNCWIPNRDFSWGFMDDNSEHLGRKIHSSRIPIPSKAPIITLRDIKVLHYQYTDWERMKSKHRWYQCWERLNQSSRSAIDIYRQYHHMYSISPEEFIPLQKEWFSGYLDNNIDMTSVRSSSVFWWDKEVISWLDKHGTTKFKKEAIWDLDWSKLAKQINSGFLAVDYSDPRSKFDKLIHIWLKRTQPIVTNILIRLIDKCLKFIGC